MALFVFFVILKTKSSASSGVEPYSAAACLWDRLKTGPIGRGWEIAALATGRSPGRKQQHRH